jgi:hypothetical protein
MPSAGLPAGFNADDDADESTMLSLVRDSKCTNHAEPWHFACTHQQVSAQLNCSTHTQEQLMAISNPMPESIDDRAQPGDVLGIEHDGETTQLGDTAEDEDERLRDAEEEAEEQAAKD